MHTPEFLAWAIEYRCPLRGELDGSDPERIERQLRSARAVSEAQREGRVLDGLCVLPPDGFRLSDALAIYGGESAVRNACCGCPANALAESDPAALAGCFGEWPVPEDLTAFHQAIEQSMARWDESFLPTKPRWYGLWLNSPLEAEWLLAAFQILELPEICCREQQELLVALNTAYNIGGRVHVRLYPPGRVEGPWWKLDPHCPACKARWPSRNATEGAAYSATEGAAYSGRCGVCGYSGHPAPEQKRRARGRRPYFPLERLLGKEQAAELLVKYEAERARRGSPDRA